MFKKFLVAVVLLGGCFWAKETLAVAVDCTSADAQWNKAEGISPGFKCLKIALTQENKKKYAVIIPSSANCTGIDGCKKGSCQCARVADCSALYGGQGYECVSFKGNIKESDYDIKPFHCPDVNSYKCAKLKSTPAATSTEEVAVPLAAATTTTTVKKQATLLPISGCCVQIVPQIDHNVQNYGLNHLVQVGINLYKCILCIVGSLMVMMTVYGGLLMVLAAGNPSKIAEGKKVIQAAVIGGIIVFASYLVVSFVVRGLGADFSNESKVQISPN